MRKFKKSVVLGFLLCTLCAGICGCTKDDSKQSQSVSEQSDTDADVGDFEESEI